MATNTDKGFYNEARKYAENWKQNYLAKEWKNDRLPIEPKNPGWIPFGPGFNGNTHPLVLPIRYQWFNLAPSIRREVKQYFCDEGIRPHDFFGHLLSSQAFCLNLFGKFKSHPEHLREFIVKTLGLNGHEYMKIHRLEFEWNDEEIVTKIFNEVTGTRGYKQTTSDMKIEYQYGNKDCLLLIEFKFTEGTGPSSKLPFGECSISDKAGCDSRLKLMINPKVCPLECNSTKPQYYWSIIKDNPGILKNEFLTIDTLCPFRFDGYQLMRNQLMAHLIEKRDSKRCDFLVIYDGRNDVIKKRPIKINRSEYIQLDNWKNVVQNDRFHYSTIQEVYPALSDHLGDIRNYLSIRYGLD